VHTGAYTPQSTIEKKRKKEKKRKRKKKKKKKKEEKKREIWIQHCTPLEL
jgi:hypothetical protein